MTPERFGAKGDGVRDDTKALNAALAASAEKGIPFMAKPNAVYKVTRSGTKTFVNPTGKSIPMNFGVEIPSGVDADWQGARIRCSDASTVALCNKSMSARGDVLRLANLVIEGGASSSVDRSSPLVWFWGLSKSSLKGLTVQNCSYVGGVIANCDASTLDGIKARNVRGQGWHIGGNTSDRCTDLRIGTLTASDVASFGTPNQPGNGFFIGIANSRIERITSLNCAGGIKFGSNAKDVYVASVEFDGKSSTRAKAFGSDNSGLKVQADGENDKADAIEFGTVVARNCRGTGLFIRNAGTVKIGSYAGTRNGQNGSSFDVDVASADAVSIGKLTSSGAGWGAVQIREPVQSYTIDGLSVSNCASVNASKCIAVFLGGPSGTIEDLTVEDTRKTIRIGRVIQAGPRASGTIRTFRSKLKRPEIQVNERIKIVRKLTQG